MWWMFPNKRWTQVINATFWRKTSMKKCKITSKWFLREPPTMNTLRTKKTSILKIWWTTCQKPKSLTSTNLWINNSNKMSCKPRLNALLKVKLLSIILQIPALFICKTTDLPLPMQIWTIICSWEMKNQGNKNFLMSRFLNMRTNSIMLRESSLSRTLRHHQVYLSLKPPQICIPLRARAPKLVRLVLRWPQPHWIQTLQWVQLKDHLLVQFHHRTKWMVNHSSKTKQIRINEATWHSRVSTVHPSLIPFQFSPITPRIERKMNE